MRSYRMLVGLGRGGMADINLACDDQGGVVILKTLRAPVTERRIAMFEDEARLGLLLSHPNIVTTYARTQHEGMHAIAMEFLDGQSLNHLLRRVESAARTELLDVFLWVLVEALAGLHYAHDLAPGGNSLHIVHRDFTPDNILLTYDGRVKVLDFGIAKAAGRTAKRTTTGDAKGKVRYMAPEQALGMGVDRRADVFAAGVILWELVSGAPFWRPGMSESDIFDDLIGGVYPSELAGADAELNGILRRSLDRAASERYPTAQAMRSDLLAFLNRRTRVDELPQRARTLMESLFENEKARTSRMIEGARARLAEPPKRDPKRLLAIAMTISLGALSPSLSHAQEPADRQKSDEHRAVEHFERGVKLADEGDNKLALVEFQRSYQLGHNFRVLYNIGEVQFQLGKYAQAMRTLTSYLDEGAEHVTADRRAAVERDIESLKIRTAHLRIAVDVDGADVTIDGESIGKSPLAASELVDAGSHRVTAQKLGFVGSNESITLVGGDDKPVTIHLAPESKPENRVVEVHDAPGLGPVWIGWGLTAALGVATVATAIAWRNADATLSDLKSSASSKPERDSQARTVNTLQTAAFVVGGATLAAAGVSLFFTLTRRNEPTLKARSSLGKRPEIDVGLGQVVVRTAF